MNHNVQERIKQLNIEDFIWIIYIGIILLSFISNHYERKFFLFNNINDKEKYRKIIVLIFTILIVVYLYFLQDSIKSLQSIKKSDSRKKKELVYLSFIASLLIAVSGFIFLYIALVDDNLTVELAFN